MPKRAIFAAVVGGFAVAMGGFFACGGGNGGAAGDAGADAPKGGPTDLGVTVFETSTGDTLIVLPEAASADVTLPEASLADRSIPDSSSGDHTVIDAHTKETGAKETGVKDTGHDVVVHVPDTGACVTVGVPGNAGGTTCPAPVTNTCGPGDLSGYTPVTSPPSGYAQGYCTSSQIIDIYNDCFNSDTCPEQDEGNGALPCYNCIVTNQSASVWGPIVLTAQGIANVNLAGCLQMLEPCNSACADAIQDTFVCDQQACGVNCVNADNDAGTLNPFNDCSDTANGCDPNGCFQYYNGASCEESIIETPASHPAAGCLNTSTFEQAFEAASQVFCGNGTTSVGD